MAPGCRREEGKARVVSEGPAQAPLDVCVPPGLGSSLLRAHPRHSEAPLNTVFRSNRLKHRGLQGTSHSWDAVLRWGLQGPRPAGGPNQARNGHRKARS